MYARQRGIISAVNFTFKKHTCGIFLNKKQNSDAAEDEKCGGDGGQEHRQQHENYRHPNSGRTPTPISHEANSGEIVTVQLRGEQIGASDNVTMTIRRL